MLGALNSGITGMDAAEMGMDVIGNNIANVNTCAFKAGTISFATIYSDTVSILGGSAGNEEGKGVQVVGLSSVWEQGTSEATMNPTDCAIDGNGFFKVTDNGQDYYTRAGQFRWDQNGNLTDPSGRIVQGFDWDDTAVPPAAVTGANVDIVIDNSLYSDVKIESNNDGQGLITALEDATGNRVTLYQIALFDFPNIDGLRKVSGSLYEESLNSGAPVSATGDPPGTNGLGNVGANRLEMSNVNLAREFVNLIVTQKAFQANSRVIGSSADMLTEVINIIR